MGGGARGAAAAARALVNAFREALPILYADDVDQAAERRRATGATEIMAPADQEWGERLCTFVDPHGHVIHVGANVG